MSAKERLPQELLKIEQGLSALSPTSTLSRDEVIFAAGRAAAERAVVTSVASETVDPAFVSPLWRLATTCFAALSIVLAVALMQRPVAESVPMATKPTPVSGDDATGDSPTVAAPREADLPASIDSPAVAVSTRRTSRQQTTSLRSLMDSIDEFTSRRDLAIHLNGQASKRVNVRPQLAARTRASVTSRAPTQSQLLKEFLPSSGAKKSSAIWP